MGWINKFKLSSEELSKLRLKEKEKLHEESRYVLITEKTLTDLILGIKEVFGPATASVLYHIFKRAGERKTSSLMHDLRTHRMKEEGLEKYELKETDLDEVILEVVKELETEGYAREIEHKVDWIDKRVLLRIKDPISIRLLDLAREEGISLSEDEATAILRGLIAGMLSAVTGRQIDIKRAVLDRKSKEVIIALTNIL